MKKILLSTVALAGLTATAMAADLPSRRVAPVPYVAVPVFTWTGFYIGGNAGYGFRTDENRNRFGSGLVADGTGFGATGTTGTSAVVPAAGTAFPNRRDRDGFVGGGQVGYNYQIGGVVVGVEGDIQYTDFNRGRNDSGLTYATAVPALPNIGVPGALGNVAFFRQNRVSDYYGTVRGRLGYAFDRTLVYATGGVALRDVSRRGNDTAFGFPANGIGRPEDVGYAAGAGVEYAFTPNITGRVEGMYVNFRGDRSNLVGITNTARPIYATAGNRRDDDFAVVRAGVNYKFTTF